MSWKNATIAKANRDAAHLDLEEGDDLTFHERMEARTDQKAEEKGEALSNQQAQAASKTESTPLVGGKSAKGALGRSLQRGLTLKDVVEETLKRRRRTAWRIWCVAFVTWLMFTTTVFRFYALAPFCPSIPPPKNFRNPVADPNDPTACYGPTWAMALFYSVQMGFHVGFGILAEPDAWAQLFTIVHGFLTIAFVTAALALFVAATGREATKAAAKLLNKAAVPEWGEWLMDFFINVMLPWLGVSSVLFAGTAFQVFYNHWGWMDAFYFSFFSLSTGGQVAPGSLDDVELYSVTLFLIVGIPVFGNAVGQLAEQIAKSRFLTVQ